MEIEMRTIIKRVKSSKYYDKFCSECGAKHKVINGLWLRDIREEANMDQRTFGKETNTSGPYISDIERNRRDCPSDILEAYLRLKYVN